MASMWPPKKNTAFTLYFTLYKNDGTVIANPGTITKKYSIDGAAVGDLSNSVTEEDTTYGQCSLVIAQAEMNGDAIWIYIKDDTSGCVPFTCTLYTTANTQDEIGTDVAAVHTHVGTIDGHITADYGATEKAAIDLLDDADGGIGDVHTVVNGIETHVHQIDSRILGTLAAGTHNAQSGDSYAIVNGDHGLVSIQDDMDAVYAAVITNAAGADIGADTTEILTRLPDATAGAAGGLLIAGSNAATTFASLTVTAALTSGSIVNNGVFTQTGNVTLSGTLGTGAVTLSALTVTNNLLVSGTTTHTGAVTLTGGINAGAVTGTGFSTHSAADVKTAMEAAGGNLALILADTGELQTNQGNWLTATGFSTLDAADVTAAVPTTAQIKTAIEADGSSLYELIQRLNGKAVIDRGAGTIKVYKANGTDLIFTLTMATVGDVDTVTRA